MQWILRISGGEAPTITKDSRHNTSGLIIITITTGTTS